MVREWFALAYPGQEQSWRGQNALERDSLALTRWELKLPVGRRQARLIGFVLQAERNVFG